MSSHCLLVSMVYVGQSVFNFTEKYFYVVSHFSLAVSKVFTLSLRMDSLIMMCLDTDLFELISLGVFWGSWMCRLLLFFIKCGKVLTITFSLFYFASLPLSFHSGTSSMDTLVQFVQISKELFLFLNFFFCFLDYIISVGLSSMSLILSFVCSNPLLSFVGEFFISVFILFY